MIATRDRANGRMVIHELDRLGRSDAAAVGSKAATLALLRSAGFAVPDGFVITGMQETAVDEADVRATIAEALNALGGGAVAVRSSAAAEDLADASFAGQYESVIGVEGLAAVLVAIKTVLRSAVSGRVTSYRDRTPGRADPPGMTILVQRLVPAEKAGVAFTADPVSGDRSVTVVSAVNGLGERLVSGAAVPDEWEVKAGTATARRTTEGAIDATVAVRVAELARRVEAALGGPQDIEWAAVGGDLFLLQARPMTALPDAVSWDPRVPGVWLRSIRLGEWLGDPVTPLFEASLLSRIERRFNGTMGGILGMTPPEPQHVVVNGWYFYGFNFLPSGRADMLRFVFLHALPRFIRRPRLVARAFPPLAWLGVGPAEEEWRREIQPRYRRQVALAHSEVEVAAPERLVALIDELADAAGDYFVSLATVTGYASKAQIPLARFYTKQLAHRIGGSHLDLLSGLGEQAPRSSEHAVHSLDWFEPTLGETRHVVDPAVVSARHVDARRRRLEAEARSREALAHEPRLLASFERLLEVAQRFALVREEQVAEFTLPWPVLRRAVLRLGEWLVGVGALERHDQVFFLTRDEVSAAVTGGRSHVDITTQATQRRGTWERQRRLVPPLTLGNPPPMLAAILKNAEEAVRGPASMFETGLVGVPASPGRATGPARIVHGFADFDRVEPGDVLVAPLTAPAWTPLFERVVAIVTDTGGVAAHASIVAREYGLPAVVGTGSATASFRDGEVLEVDGSTGIVRQVDPEHG
jgi:phosphohistidine swiveling domain-containing protein